MVLASVFALYAARHIIIPLLLKITSLRIESLYPLGAKLESAQSTDETRAGPADDEPDQGERRERQPGHGDRREPGARRAASVG